MPAGRGARQDRQHHAAAPGIFADQRLDHAGIDVDAVHPGVGPEHRPPFADRDGAEAQRQPLDHHQRAADDLAIAAKDQRLGLRARPAGPRISAKLLLHHVVEAGRNAVPFGRREPLDREPGDHRRVAPCRTWGPVVNARNVPFGSQRHQPRPGAVPVPIGTPCRRLIGKGEQITSRGPRRRRSFPNG